MDVIFRSLVCRARKDFVKKNIRLAWFSLFALNSNLASLPPPGKWLGIGAPFLGAVFFGLATVHAAGVRFSGFLLACLALIPNVVIEVYLGHTGLPAARHKLPARREWVMTTPTFVICKSWVM
jgi:hypothetical protein